MQVSMATPAETKTLVERHSRRHPLKPLRLLLISALVVLGVSKCNCQPSSGGASDAGPTLAFIPYVPPSCNKPRSEWAQFTVTLHHDELPGEPAEERFRDKVREAAGYPEPDLVFVPSVIASKLNYRRRIATNGFVKEMALHVDQFDLPSVPSESDCSGWGNCLVFGPEAPIIWEREDPYGVPGRQEFRNVSTLETKRSNYPQSLAAPFGWPTPYERSPNTWVRDNSVSKPAPGTFIHGAFAPGLDSCSADSSSCVQHWLTNIKVEEGNSFQSTPLIIALDTAENNVGGAQRVNLGEGRACTSPDYKYDPRPTPVSAGEVLDGILLGDQDVVYLRHVWEDRERNTPLPNYEGNRPFPSRRRTIFSLWTENERGTDAYNISNVSLYVRCGAEDEMPNDPAPGDPNSGGSFEYVDADENDLRAGNVDRMIVTKPGECLSRNGLGWNIAVYARHGKSKKQNHPVATHFRLMVSYSDYDTTTSNLKVLPGREITAGTYFKAGTSQIDSMRTTLRKFMQTWWGVTKGMGITTAPIVNANLYNYWNNTYCECELAKDHDCEICFSGDSITGSGEWNYTASGTITLKKDAPGMWTWDEKSLAHEAGHLLWDFPDEYSLGFTEVKCGRSIMTSFHEAANVLNFCTAENHGHGHDSTTTVGYRLPYTYVPMTSSHDCATPWDWASRWNYGNTVSCSNSKLFMRKSPNNYDWSRSFSDSEHEGFLPVAAFLTRLKN